MRKLRKREFTDAFDGGCDVREVAKGDRQIWERIYARMKARGWSQHDLAKASGISDASISRWADGKDQPEIDSLIKVARALKTSIDELVGHESMTPEQKTILKALENEDAREAVQETLARVAKIQAKAAGTFVEKPPKGKEDSGGQ